METLLSVDVGVRTGMAVFGRDGRLLRHLSRNFGSAARLRRAIPVMLAEVQGLSVLVLEGGGPLADAWAKEAERRGVRVLRTVAERWRERLLVPRLRRSGSDAKRNAEALARRVIAWSGAARTKTRRRGGRSSSRTTTSGTGPARPRSPTPAGSAPT